jgi:plasmid stabilization system protein ParE
MQIIRTVFYGKELKKILEYIAKDKLGASKKFKKKLDEHINDILVFPRKYRKSKYFEDENIRDMIFSGYTVIYEIFEDRIEILTVFNQNLPLK